MTTLQIVMLVVWLAIMLVIISAEGWKDGTFICFLFTIQIGFFAAMCALGYYTSKALFQVFK